MSTTEPSNEIHDDAMEQAWRDVIIDHNQFPRGLKPVAHPSHQGAGKNPFCGDEISLSLRLSAQGVIEEAGIDTRGCAISRASASMMVAQLPGLDLEQARCLFREVHSLLTCTDAPPVSVRGLEALQLVRNYPLRVKCASLPWHVLNSVLKGSEEVVSTE